MNEIEKWDEISGVIRKALRVSNKDIENHINVGKNPCYDMFAFKYR